MPRILAVVMSLPRVDVRMQIKKSVQVIRLNAPEFKPANVTRMSRETAQQSGLATPRTLSELALLAIAPGDPTSIWLTPPLSAGSFRI